MATSSLTRQNLAQITSRYRVILVDNYGVLRRAADRFPKAYQAVSQLQDEGKEVFLFSNTGDNNEHGLQEELKREGINIDRDHIITPGTVLALALQKLGLEGKRLLCLGNKSTEEYIVRAGATIEQSTKADAAIIGTYFQKCDTNSIETFTQLCVLQKKPALLLNLDELVPCDERKNQAGPAYNWNNIARKTRVKVIGVGKPEWYMYKYVQEQTGIPTSEILAVGDTLATDIAGAINAKVDSLLVLSGITKPYNYQGTIQTTGLYPTYISPKFEF